MSARFLSAEMFKPAGEDGSVAALAANTLEMPNETVKRSKSGISLNA